MSFAAGLLGLAGCSEVRETASGGDGVEDTDGDGVIDTEDYAPWDPEIQSEDQIIKVNATESTENSPNGGPNETGTATGEGDLVDLNTANEQELMTLPGVGEARATRIIEFRASLEEPITDPYQLTEVSGISQELIESWAGLIKPPLGGTDSDTTTESNLVDLNTASKQELTTLPGVGEARATRIIDYRNNRSEPITDPYQLTEVSGISQELIESWAGLVTPPLGGTDSDTTTESDLVDLNTASKQELMTLPGVGEARATRIIDYRENRSEPIDDPYELTEVSGITRELIESWAGLIKPPLPS